MRHVKPHPSTGVGGRVEQRETCPAETEGSSTLCWPEKAVRGQASSMSTNAAPLDVIRFPRFDESKTRLLTMKEKRSKKIKKNSSTSYEFVNFNLTFVFSLVSARPIVHFSARHLCALFSPHRWLVVPKPESTGRRPAPSPGEGPCVNRFY